MHKLESSFVIFAWSFGVSIFVRAPSLFSPLRLTTGEASFLSPRVIRGGVLFIRGGVELGFRRGIFGVLRRRGIFVISEGYFYFWSGWGIFGISEEEGYFWSPGRIGILEGWNWGVSLTVKRF